MTERTGTNKKTVIINSMSSAVSLVANLTVLIWLQQFLLKRISPEEYSILPVLMSIMAFTPLLTAILTSGLGRQMTLSYVKGDDEEVTKICSTMFPILCAAGILFLSLGLFLAHNIASVLDIDSQYIDDAKLMLSVLVLVASLRFPLAIYSSAFVVTQKLMLQDLIDLGCQFVRIILLFVFLFGISVEIKWVVIATALSELLNLAISTPVARRLVPAMRIRFGVFKSHIAKTIISYGGWGFLQQTSKTIKDTFDVIILNRFASALQVTLFYVSGLAPRQLIYLTIPLTRPFIPVLTSMIAVDDYFKLKNTYLRVARYHSWLLLCVGIPAIIFSNEIMHIYLDGKYPETGNLMAILLLISVSNGFNALGYAVAAAAGELRGLSLRTLLVNVTSMATALYLIVVLNLGALGSVIATVSCYFILEITIVWRFCRKIANADLYDWVREVVKPCLITAIPSILICLSLKEILDITTLIELLLSSALSALVYILLILKTGLREQDILDINQLISKMSPKYRQKLMLQ